MHNDSQYQCYANVAVLYLKVIIMIQKSGNVIIMESNDLEMTVSENHDRKS